MGELCKGKKSQSAGFFGPFSLEGFDGKTSSYHFPLEPPSFCLDRFLSRVRSCRRRWLGNLHARKSSCGPSCGNRERGGDCFPVIELRLPFLFFSFSFLKAFSSQKHHPRSYPKRPSPVQRTHWSLPCARLCQPQTGQRPSPARQTRLHLSRPRKSDPFSHKIMVSCK